MKWQINYWSNSVETHPTTWEIYNDGRATLTVLSNENNRSQQQIGIYQSQLAAEQVTLIESLVTTPDFIVIQTFTNILPGELVRSFRIMHSEMGEIEKTVGQSVAVPRAFEEAEAVLEQLETEILKHPKFALSLHMDSLPSIIQANSKLSIPIQIKNIGTETIRLVHPGQWSEGDGLEVRMIRSDLGPEELTSDSDMFFEWVSGSAVRTTDIPERPHSGQLELLPEQVLQVVAHQKIECAPATYDLAVAYQSDLADSQGKPLYSFMIVTPATKLTVN